MTENNLYSNSKTKALSCRFKVSTIIACYDIQELIGRNPINKAMSTVVSQSLDALVATLRLEGKLPVYTDEAAIQERLIQMIGVQKQGEDDPMPLPALLADRMGASDTDFEGAFEEAESTLPDPVIVDRPIEIVAPPAETAPKPPTFSELLEAWPNDALLASCKGDPTSEAAISLVYANLPASQRNSPLAQTLLASTKKLLAEAATVAQSKEK